MTTPAEREQIEHERAIDETYSALPWEAVRRDFWRVKAGEHEWLHLAITADGVFRLTSDRHPQPLAKDYPPEALKDLLRIAAAHVKVRDGLVQEKQERIEACREALRRAGLPEAPATA